MEVVSEDINIQEEQRKIMNEAVDIESYILGHQKLMNLDQKFDKNELEIKESKLKNGGLGLFTNVPIPANNILCFYPLDLIQDLNNPDTFYKNGEKTLIEQSEENKEKVYYGDFTIVMENYRIIAEAGLKKNHLYCGHMANDKGYNPQKTYKPQLNNCRYEALNIVSNRNIKIGEEIYVSYGKQYWYGTKEGKEKSRHLEIKDI